jgi:hypothetical protein
LRTYTPEAKFQNSTSVSAMKKTTVKKYSMALMIAAAISSPAFATTLDYTGTLQTFVAPTDGTYFILAAGAQGGSAYGGNGGAGTKIEGSINLTAGSILDILVGGSGLTGDFGTIWGGGGGGGTFVWADGSTTPLLIGGGGGGAGYSGQGGAAASLYQENGFKGFGPGGGAGGTSGSGGQGGYGYGGNYNGGGGGGWYGNGTAGAGSPPGSGTGSAGDGGIGAFAFTGGAGGYDYSGQTPANGGYGGGGGGGWQGGGGGGGYAGGGGGDGTDYAGGAGGSYLAGSLTGAGFLSGGNQADGFVEISETPIDINTGNSVPEAGSVALFMLMGLSSLPVVRRFRK